MIPAALRRRARTATSLMIAGATLATVTLTAAGRSSAAAGDDAVGDDAVGDEAVGDEVFSEDFDAVADGQLPDGFFASTGEWSVQHGELVGRMADNYAPGVVTFGDRHLSDYRVEFDMRFDAVNGPSRWAGVLTDVDATGAAPWWQAIVRSDGSSVEFAQRTTGGGWNVTNSTTAPAPGVGTPVDVRIDVHGDRGDWYLNDELVLSTDAMHRSDTGVLGFVLAGATVAFDNVVVTELEPLPTPEPDLYRYEQNFDEVPDQALPEGWNAVEGNWAVRDGVLHLDNHTGLGRVTFGEHLDNYAVSASIRFDTRANSSRWAGIMTDVPASGAQPWSHAVMRSASTAGNGIEFAMRTAGGGWNVTDATAAPTDAGLGNWVDVRVVMHGSRGEWYFNGELVLETTSHVRSADGVFGLIGANVTISVDDVVIEELEYEPRSFVREPGQGPITIAHRGHSSLAPENTMAAFESAIRSGAEMFEIDTYTTAAGSHLVMHDGTVDRTTDGTGASTGLSDEYLRSLDAGTWFSPAYAGQPVPFLEDVLDLANGRGSMVLWEIKQIASPSAMEDAVAEIHARGMDDQVMIQSFNATYLAWARDIAPEIPRAYLGNPGSNPLALADELGLSAWNMSAGWILANPGFVQELHDVGVAVMPYTVNDPATWRALTEIAVDGIITDRASQHIGFRQGSPIEVTWVEPEPTEPPEPTPVAARVEQATGQADPTTLQPVLFDVAFSQPIVGFDTDDVVIGGAAGATEVTISEITPGIRYRVAVGGATADGDVTVAVAEGAATNAAGTPTAGSTSADNSVTVGLLAACAVDYAIARTWNGGFRADLTLTNTSTEPLVGWQVGWSFAGDEAVTNGWRGEFRSEDGSVTVTNLDWNRVVEPGGQVTFGFTGAWTDSMPVVPTGFTLGGVPCGG